MKSVLSLIMALLAGSGAFAQPAMPFIRTDRNPATSAMGGAEAVSPLYNPGVVPFAEKSDVTASYQLWAPSTMGMHHINLLGGIRLGDRFGLTLSGAYQMGKSYTVTDEAGAVRGTYSPTEYLGGAGLGFRITDGLGIGGAFRFSAQHLAENALKKAFSADLFVVYRQGGIIVTGGIASIGTSVAAAASDPGKHFLPTSAKIGAGYAFSMEEGRIRVAADADYFLFCGGVGIAAGVEYAYKELVFLRSGIHLGSDSIPFPTYVSLGAGVKFSGVHLDISYLTINNVIGNTLTAGIGYEF